MSSSPHNAGSPALPDADHLRALIAAMAGGDRDALRSLVQCTAPWLYPVARRLVGGDGDVGSALCVRLFVEIWRVSPCYDRNLGPPMAWMLLVLRDEAGCADKSSVSVASLDPQGLDSQVLERLWFAEPGGADGN